MPETATVPPEKAAAPLILSLDIGTSSTRALLFDRLGRAVDGALARRPVELITNAGGKAEIDPNELLEATWHCIDKILAENQAVSKQIAAVVSCSFVSNLMGIDSDGNPTTPLMIYADTRPAAESQILQNELDLSATYARVGCLFYHPSYQPARFLWLDRLHPNILARTERWISFGEYMTLKLFGTNAVSFSTASWTGLLNRHQLTWDEELLSALPITAENLSPLVDIDDPWRGLISDYAQRWPVLANLPWFPTIGDGATANIGSGCDSPDEIAITMGTSSAIRAVIPGTTKNIPQGLWCYRVDSHHSLLGGAMSEGGNISGWMKKNLKLKSKAELDARIAQLEPDAHGLTFLPLLSGERSPGWVGDARGALTGISLSTTALEIYRAGLEGVACRLGLIFDLLKPAVSPQPQVIASGGALLHSPTLLQIVADVLGNPVTTSQVLEASARGAALLGLKALGEVEDLRSFPKFTGQTYQPDLQNHAIYAEAKARQQALYQQAIRAE
ncbi:MAG: gluconokinase [Anaerolineales bacterium]|nr:gluconokinase [Anaerolineales bacterium]